MTKDTLTELEIKEILNRLDRVESMIDIMCDKLNYIQRQINKIESTLDKE